MKGKLNKMRKTSLSTIARKIGDQRRDAFQYARYTNMIGEALASQAAPVADPSNWVILRTVKDGGAVYEINFETFFNEFKDWVVVENMPCLVRNPAFGIREGESKRNSLIEMLLAPGELHTSKAFYSLKK